MALAVETFKTRHLEDFQVTYCNMHFGGHIGDPQLLSNISYEKPAVFLIIQIDVLKKLNRLNKNRFNKLCAIFRGKWIS